jgi:hypothetical protein
MVIIWSDFVRSGKSMTLMMLWDLQVDGNSKCLVRGRYCIVSWFSSYFTSLCYLFLLRFSISIFLTGRKWFCVFNPITARLGGQNPM